MIQLTGKPRRKKGKGAKKAKKISWENVMYTPKKAVSGQWKTPLLMGILGNRGRMDRIDQSTTN